MCASACLRSRRWMLRRVGMQRMACWRPHDLSSSSAFFGLDLAAALGQRCVLGARQVCMHAFCPACIHACERTGTAACQPERMLDGGESALKSTLSRSCYSVTCSPHSQHMLATRNTVMGQQCGQQATSRRLRTHSTQHAPLEVVRADKVGGRQLLHGQAVALVAIRGVAVWQLQQHAARPDQRAAAATAGCSGCARAAELHGRPQRCCKRGRILIVQALHTQQMHADMQQPRQRPSSAATIAAAATLLRASCPDAARVVLPRSHLQHDVFRDAQLSRAAAALQLTITSALVTRGRWRRLGVRLLPRRHGFCQLVMRRRLKIVAVIASGVAAALAVRSAAAVAALAPLSAVSWLRRHSSARRHSWRLLLSIASLIVASAHLALLLVLMLTAAAVGVAQVAVTGQHRRP